MTNKNSIIITHAQQQKIDKLISKYKDHINDETLWTWVVANILQKEISKNSTLIEYIIGKKINVNDLNIGFEVQPLSTRKGVRGNTEGNTHLDLAIGHFIRRGGRDSGGIKFNHVDNSMVCFIEAKMYSDLSTGTTHDKLRNQMTRVIENLLCFQNEAGKFPDDICFTLLTPRAFKLNPKSRLYGYKYFDYLKDLSINGSLIEYDINQLDIPKRYESNWKYPIIASRLKKLRLNWVTYEDIFEYHIKNTFNMVDDFKKKNLEKYNILF